MKVLVTVLFVSFLIGGGRRGLNATKHPVILLGFCTLLALSFLKLSVIQ